jgi:hypothetical protein
MQQPLQVQHIFRTESVIVELVETSANNKFEFLVEQEVNDRIIEMETDNDTQIEISSTMKLQKIIWKM